MTEVMIPALSMAKYNKEIMEQKPLIYRQLNIHLTSWPSLTCDWISFPDASLKIIMGSHTSSTDNYILISNISDVNSVDFKLTLNDKVHHEGVCNRIRHSPLCSNVIASQSDNGSVYVYNLQNSKEKPITLNGQKKEGYGLSWSPILSDKLLSASYDGSIHLWDVEKNQDSVLKFHTKEAADVCWHPTKQHVFASVGDDHRLNICDLSINPNKPALSINAHDSQVNTVDYNKFHEYLLVTGSSDTNLKIWDTRKLTNEMHLLADHSNSVLVATWSPLSPHILASSSESQINLWDLTKVGETQTSDDIRSGPPELIFSHSAHKVNISDFSWCPVRPWALCSVSTDNTLHIWEIAPDLVEESLEIADFQFQ